jgi:hypothetical protein
MGVTITALVGIFIYVSNRSTKHFQNRLDPKQQQFFTLSLVTLAGVLRGLLLYLSTDLGGFEQPTSLLARLISSTATTLFWLTLFSIVVEDARVFRDKYESLVRTSILRIAQAGVSREKQQFSPELQEEISEIESLLSKTFDEATRTAMDHTTMLLAAMSVRKTIEENIRPLSHRLWLRSASSLPAVRIRGTAMAGLKNLDVPPFVPAALLALTSVFNLTTSFGWYRGIYGSIFIFLVFNLFYQNVMPSLRKISSGTLAINFAFTLIPGLVLSLIFYLSNKYLFNDDSGLLNFIYIVIFFIVACVASIYKLTQSDREHLLAMMERNLLPSKMVQGNSEGVINENMASYLHNSLQSELLALSYQFEESAKDPNSENSRALLEQLGSRINRSISEDFENFVEKPLDRLHRIQSAWRGIAEVKIDIPDRLLIDSNRNFLVVQIIEEAISNAVRFSNSSEISVIGQETSNAQIKVVISNNGLAEHQTSSGLGTEWLDRFAAGKWTRTHSESGTVLEITL